MKVGSPRFEQGSRECPESLRVFGRLPVTGVRGCTEAGVRKASREETAGEFATAVVTIYGDLAPGLDRRVVVVATRSSEGPFAHPFADLHPGQVPEGKLDGGEDNETGRGLAAGILQDPKGRARQPLGLMAVVRVALIANHRGRRAPGHCNRARSAGASSRPGSLSGSRAPASADRLPRARD